MIELNNLAKKAINSRDSLEKLFDKIYPLIWHFYKIRIKNTDDAMDLTQNACIKIVNNLTKYKEQRSSFTTWMYTIIKNMLIDFYRKKSITIDADIDFNLIEGVDSPIDNIIKKEDKKYLKQAFDDLTPRQKEIMEMRYYFNIKNRDIAKTLNINEKTVSSLIVKSCERIKELLNKINF